MRLIFILVPFLLLSACNGPEQFTWNQRMTVTVETPDGPVTGSSVIEVLVAYNESGGGLARDVQFQVRHRGEAVAVEVLPEQYLFVPLRVPSSLLYSADPGRFGGPDVGFPDYSPMVDEQTEPFHLCGGYDFCPDMIALVEQDLHGLREVTPDTIVDVFGAGFAIAEVTLEVTEDPVTSGQIAPALRWTCTDFDPEQPGMRPILLLRDEGTEFDYAVPYRDFSTDNFCEE